MRSTSWAESWEDLAGDVPVTPVLAARAGRIAFFSHEPAPGDERPAVIQKWIDHERAVLAALQGGVEPGVPHTDWAPGLGWVIWRLLSGNNREIGRGVGTYGTLTGARRAAERAVANADRAEGVPAFDRHTSHGWALLIDGEAVLVSPAWSRSRRSSRLNLDTVRMTLRRAELNDLATPIGVHFRANGTVPS